MAGSIIIIGAGAAGLYSAFLLKEKHRNITILEARPRTGGRIHSIAYPFTSVVEAGAEFVHGKLPVTSKLLKNAQRKMSAVTGEFYEVKNNVLQDASFMNDEIEAVSKAMRGLNEDIPFSAFLATHFSEGRFSSLRQRLLSLVQGYDGADPSRISTFAVRDEWSEWNDEEDYRIKGGYQGLIEYLETAAGDNGVDIRLSQVVEHISWTKGAVSVKTQDNLLHAEKILITVPISILQQGLITFSPDIPTYSEAARRIGFGAVVKFIFEFKKEIEGLESFRKIKDFRFIFCDREIPTWWSQLPLTANIFTGWLAGPNAFLFPRDPREQYVKAIDTLAYILDSSAKEVESLISCWQIYDWVADPFCRGAYGYQTPETIEARKILNLPVADTIYFAGEALSEGDSMGTVEAALASAEDVVKKIERS